MADLYSSLCSYQNLYLAYRKARTGKTQKDYVLDFEKDLTENLQELRTELLLHSYHPQPLQTFIIHDPKTRKISKSAFRDRIVHHTLCNIIEPIFEKKFIFDSYANRRGKGTFKAIERFDAFNRQVSKNYTRPAFVLKADIKKYFENVDLNILQSIIRRKVKDEKVLWLIKIILSNYLSHKIGKGMPLGNLTSQFFANVYLNELDQFVKHKLNVKYYVRYVDDFVILHASPKQLRDYKVKIEKFLTEKLELRFHPDKSKIMSTNNGVEFLGMRIFLRHKLLKKKNLRKFERKLKTYSLSYDDGDTNYDQIYDFVEGWCAYAKNADTYQLRQRLTNKFEIGFKTGISTKEINRMHGDVKNKKRIQKK